MDKLNLSWFTSLDRREQLMLAIGGSVLVAWLFFVAIWKPLASSNESLRKANKTAQEQLVWMRNSAAYIAKQKSSGSQSTSSGNLSQLLNASLADGDLRFSRFQPRGDLQAQVWFDSAEFEKLFLWLNELQQQQVSIRNVSISSGSQSGVVSASLQLELGQ